MLISLKVENWLSFKESAEFSMVASKERQHGNRVPKVSKYQTRILPVASIYGGNASGKTNLFKALSFIKDFVVDGTRPESMILTEPFRLDKQSIKKPSKFKIEMLIDEKIYEFSFSVTQKAVIEEKLIQITSTSEKVLYHRKKDKVNMHLPLLKDGLLQFAFKGTRDNQLFLTNSVSQKVEVFAPIYNWFKHTLVLIAPDTRFGQYERFLDDKNPLFETMNEMLSTLDTGIKHLKYIDMPFENIPIPEGLRNNLREDVTKGVAVRLHSNHTNERYIISRNKNELQAKKLVTYHSKSSGEDEKFELQQESDGSLRVIDFLPAFLDLSMTKTKKVYIIDEVNRSLHTALTKQLIEVFLCNCSKDSRSQLLFTTHDLLLMDQDLLRRDEMWVAERDDKGMSSLRSFIEYKEIRYDKDIRKSYLQGRLGGTPKINLKSSLKSKKGNC
ncbi:MAG: ATP-binding protein [Candidatus Delongbacteria bacterium]|jgi:AAA15 family ATPase/GTPase|nr:ATP-binding protein [Candidatus Delongbacteria bacterium]